MSHTSIRNVLKTAKKIQQDDDKSNGSWQEDAENNRKVDIIAVIEYYLHFTKIVPLLHTDNSNLRSFILNFIEQIRKIAVPNYPYWRMGQSFWNGGSIMEIYVEKWSTLVQFCQQRLQELHLLQFDLLSKSTQPITHALQFRFEAVDYGYITKK